MLNLVVDRSSAVPPYRPLYDHVRHLIESRQIRPGERLPPLRQMIREFRLSNVTIQRALRELREEGLLVCRSGSGLYVGEGRPVARKPADL